MLMWSVLVCFMSFKQLYFLFLYAVNFYGNNVNPTAYGRCFATHGA